MKTVDWSLLVFVAMGIIVLWRMFRYHWHKRKTKVRIIGGKPMEHYPIVISGHGYHKLFAVRDYPQTTYYLKDKEISLENFIKILHCIDILNKEED